MKSLIKNSILPIINFTLIALAGYLLYLDYTSTVAESGTVQIGTITFKQRIAERKYTRQVIWEKLQNNSPVYNFDSIRTDANSLAVINLNDGTSIELEEETMVVLQQSQKGLDVDFEKGGISAQTSGSDLNISADGAALALSNGGLNLSRNNENDLDVNVESGNAQLTAAGQTTRLDPSRSASVTRQGATVDERPITLLAPAASSNIIARKPAPVTFSWRLEEEKDSTFQLSKKQDFSSIINQRKQQSRTAETTVTLDAGIYYWRVLTDSSTSQKRRVAIVTENRPIILRPQKMQQFSYKTQKPLVTFKWNGAESAYVYTVEIASDSSMTDIVKRYQTYESLVSTDELDTGTYFCRIIAIYNLGNEKKEVKSRVRQFSVTKSARLNPPKLLSPYNNQKILVENSSTTFNWEKVPEASAYMLSVKDNSSGTALVNTRVRSHYYNYSRTFPPGTYSWNVSAIGPDDSRSAESATYTFRVASEGKITPLAPQNGKMYLGTPTIQFRWKDENRGDRYRLQIARDPQFSSTVAQKTLTTRSASFNDTSSGTYYWRIQLLNNQNNAILSSSTSSFSVVDSLSTPRLTTPAGKTFPHDTGSIQLNWKPVNNATHYRIEVFRKSFPGAQRIDSALLRGRTSYTLNMSSLREGDYSWRVRAFLQQEGKTVMKSPPAEETFSKEKKEIEEETELEITSPSTIFIQ